MTTTQQNDERNQHNGHGTLCSGEFAQGDHFCHSISVMDSHKTKGGKS